MSDAKRPSFKSDEELWAYIEEQEALLNQLDDAFSKVKKKPRPHEGTPESPTPFKETERLAMQGDAISQYNLSVSYLNGDGVVRDIERSAQWLLKSAEAGFAPAEYNIGCHWQERKDITNAHAWFLKSAKQNFGPAQFNLGNMYGRSGDFLRAYVWFYLAEQNRIEKAKENRETVAARLSKDELNNARMLVSAEMMAFTHLDATQTNPLPLSNEALPDDLVEFTHELTAEENEVIENSLDEYAQIFASNHDGAAFVTPVKMMDGMKAQALVEYSEELLSDLDESPESAATVKKALQALVKAYCIQSLPAYIFQIATVYEFNNNDKEARRWYKNFLRVQKEFKPDAIDDFWINYLKYDLPQMIKTATTKALG